MDNTQGNRYWFNIDTHVHISMKGGNVLFYNVYSGKILDFPSEKYGNTILDLTKKLLSPKNLRVILLASEDLKNPSISEFVRLIRESFMGDLIDAAYSSSKPFQAAPTRVKVHNDVRNHLKDPDLNLGSRIMEYMYEFTLYLNDSCAQKCLNCGNLYKQSIWCHASKKQGHYLDIPLLKNFLEEIKGCNLNNIDITGGNILLYPHLEELATLLVSLDYPVHIYLNYLNVDEKIEKLEWLQSIDHRLRLLSHFPFDEGRFKNVYRELSGKGYNLAPVFFVQSEEEYALLEQKLSEYSFETVTFLPFYNGKNFEFFRSNIFITREAIEAQKPEQRKIDGNSKINMDNFGRITILANGNVHANVMTASLGNLRKNSVYDCILNEMKSGKNWFRLRKNVMPCKQCNFEFLCPPLSNYNRALGRNNMCDNFGLLE